VCMNIYICIEIILNIYIYNMHTHTLIYIILTGKAAGKPNDYEVRTLYFTVANCWAGHGS